jgi:hypothetical protein
MHVLHIQCTNDWATMPTAELVSVEWSFHTSHHA